jgi:hypothetical protein
MLVSYKDKEACCNSVCCLKDSEFAMDCIIASDLNVTLNSQERGGEKSTMTPFKGKWGNL